MRDLFFAPPTSRSPVADLGLLILRLMGGLALAFGHGVLKIPPAAGFIGMLGGLGFPMPGVWAWLVAIVEFGGGLLLAVGLLTRPVAAVVSIHFLVITLYVHRADPFKDKELAVLFLMWALTLLCTGAGRFSLDGLISGRRRTV